MPMDCNDLSSVDWPQALVLCVGILAAAAVLIAMILDDR